MKPQWLNRALVVGPYFTLCLTEADFHRELARLSIPRSQWGPFLGSKRANATAHYLDNPDGQQCVIVCLADSAGRPGVEVAGLLVHEAVHIWQEHCRRIGEREPSDEFEAYAVQTISQQLMQEFVRQTAAERT